MRTRNHIIEEESKTQLSQIIPDYWLYRDKGKDYGIDCEIEIFDKVGNSTGKVFWVQLKATDSKIKSGKQSISFSIDKIKQFKSYPLPVLILRYSTEERSFYGRWAKSIEFKGGKEIAKNITIKFADTDKWDSNIFNRIENYLEKIKLIKGNKLVNPLRLNFEFLQTNRISTPLTIFISNLRLHIKPFEELIKFEADEKLALAKIVISDNQFRFNLMGEGGTIIKHNLNFNSDNDYKLASKYILSGLAICLCNSGQQEFGIRIIFETQLFPFLAENKQMLIFLIPFLLTGYYYEQSVDEITKIIADDKDDNLIQSYTQIHLLISENKKVNKIEDFLKAQVAKAFDLGSDELIAISFYNLANLYMSTSNPSKALTNYLNAKRYDKTYLKRDYFLGELAGTFHNLGRYKCASNLYAKAIKINKSDLHLKVLYADSTMYSGQYKKAVELFNSYLNESADMDFNNDVWHLKYFCLSILLKNGYPELQNRNPIKANELVDFTTIKSKIEEQLEEALSYDLLCGLAWFNLGINSNSKKDFISATIAFAMCALVQNNDIEAWVNATICSLLANKTQLFINIVKVAYHYNDDKFLLELYKKLSEFNKSNLSEYFDMINEFLYEKKYKQKNIRLIENDENHNILVFET